MQKIRMIAMGSGTLAMALVAGQFVHSGIYSELAPPHAGAATPAESEGRGAAAPGALHLASIAMTSSGPALPAAAPAPGGLPPMPFLREAALGDAAARPRSGALPRPLPVEEPAPSMGCDYNLTAAPAPGALVALTLDAPCAPDERFTLHQSGMMFTEVTDEGGHADMLVPALSRKAYFIAAFPNDEGAVASAEVETLEHYQRVAVQWQGEAGVQLHALEFGSDYEGDGHVWSGASRDVAAAASGERGFLTRLGNAGQPDALMAEIYTFPSRMAGRDGGVALRVEAEVTAVNCDRDIGTQTFRIRPDGTLRVQDVTLMMPDCGAVGDFLVLNNLLNDLTIARN